MTSGAEIELRLRQKRCIRCGAHPALDWPYICDDCQKALAKEQAAKRERQGLDEV